MAKLTSAELKDLKSVGYVEGDINSFPENVSPVLRAKALEAWAEKQDTPVTGDDLPTAVDRQNQAARERSAADEDGEKSTGLKRQKDVTN